jgi:hypothetical protein
MMGKIPIVIFMSLKCGGKRAGCHFFGEDNRGRLGEAFVLVVRQQLLAFKFATISVKAHHSAL